MHPVMLVGYALARVQNHGRCLRRRRFQQLEGMKMWRGLPGAEFGVLKWIFEFLGDFGYQFQDWVLEALFGRFLRGWVKNFDVLVLGWRKIL